MKTGINSFFLKQLVRESLLTEAKNDYDPRKMFVGMTNDNKSRFQEFSQLNGQGYYWIGFGEPVNVSDEDLQNLSEMAGNEVAGLYYILRGQCNMGGNQLIARFLNSSNASCSEIIDIARFRAANGDYQKGMTDFYEYNKLHKRPEEGETISDAQRWLDARGMTEPPTEPEPTEVPSVRDSEVSDAQSGTFKGEDGEDAVRLYLRWIKQEGFYALEFTDGTAKRVDSAEMYTLAHSLHRSSASEALQSEGITQQKSMLSLQQIEELDKLIGLMGVSDEPEPTEPTKRPRLSALDKIQKEIDEDDMDIITNKFLFNQATRTPMKDLGGEETRHKTNREVFQRGGKRIWKTFPIERTVGYELDAQGNPVPIKAPIMTNYVEADPELDSEGNPVLDDNGNPKRKMGYYVDRDGNPFYSDSDYNTGDWRGISQDRLKSYLEDIHTILLKNIAFLSIGDKGPTSLHGASFFGKGGLPRSILNVASSHLSGRVNEILSMRDYIEYVLQDSGYNDWEAENFATGDDGSDWDDETNRSQRDIDMTAGKKSLEDINTKNAIKFGKAVGKAVTKKNPNNHIPTVDDVPYSQSFYRPAVESRVRRGQMLREQRNRLYLKSLVRENIARELRRGLRLF